MEAFSTLPSADAAFETSVVPSTQVLVVCVPKSIAHSVPQGLRVCGYAPGLSREVEAVDRLKYFAGHDVDLCLRVHKALSKRAGERPAEDLGSPSQEVRRGLKGGGGGGVSMMMMMMMVRVARESKDVRELGIFGRLQKYKSRYIRRNSRQDGRWGDIGVVGEVGRPIHV